MYQLRDDGWVIRESDGANIPADPRNADRKDFEAWLSKGNKPDVAVEAKPGETAVPDPLAKLVDFLKANPDVLDLVTKGIQSQGEKT